MIDLIISLVYFFGLGLVILVGLMMIYATIMIGLASFREWNINRIKVRFYDYNKKHKIGDIIFPASNGTDRFYLKTVWQVVEKVDKKGHWERLRYMYRCETAELYSEIIKLKEKVKK